MVKQINEETEQVIQILLITNHISEEYYYFGTAMFVHTWPPGD